MTKQTRGADRKYEFDTLKPGPGYVRFPDGNINAIRSSLKYWMRVNGVKWDWRCYTDEDKSVVVIRNK